MVAFGPDGAIYYLYTPSASGKRDRLFITRSTDGGATFTPPKLVDPGVPSDNSDVHASIAVDQTSGAKGRVYVTWDRSSLQESQRIFTASSSDGGATFSTPRRVSPASQVYPEETETAVGPDGRVYVSWFDKTTWYGSYPVGPGTLYVASSGDQGGTFSPPVAVGTTGGRMCSGLTCEIHFDDLTDMHALAAGPLPDLGSGPQGQVVMAWYDRLITGRIRVFAAVSTDGGQSWSPALLSPRFFGVPPGGEGHDQHRPGVWVAPNGRVDLAYYDLDANGLQDVYSIFSCDRGQTVSAPTKVTTATSDARVGPPSSGARISLVGEVGVASTSDQLAAAWTDTRNGNTQDKRQAVFFGSHTGVPSSCAGQPPGPDPGTSPPSSPGPGGDGGGAVPGGGGPAGGGPAPTGPGADRDAPLISLSGPTVQSVRRRSVFVFVETDEDAALTGQGILARPRLTRRRAPRLAPVTGLGTPAAAVTRRTRVFRLRRVRAQAQARQKVRLKLRLPARAVRAVRSGLAAGRRSTTRLTITATDRAGNTATAKRTIRLKR